MKISEFIKNNYPESIQRRLIQICTEQNTLNEELPEKYQTKAGCILFAFTWAKTSEKTEYWLDFYYTLKNQSDEKSYIEKLFGKYTMYVSLFIIIIVFLFFLAFKG